MAEAILIAAEEEAEAEAEVMPEVRQRRPPDHTPAVLRFVAPPDSPEGEGRAYSMPYTPDRKRWERFIRGATDSRGVFAVEIRNRNQSIIGRDSIEVAPEPGAQPQTTAAPTAPQYAAPPAAPLGGSDTAQVISSFADSFVSINKVMKDNAEKAQPDLEQIVSRLAEAMKPAQAPPPPDPTETLTRTVGFLKTLGLIPEKNQEPQREQKDPAEAFLDQLSRFRNISEELGPQPESKGWGAQVGSLFEGLGRGVEKIVPAIPQLLTVARMGAQMLAPPQPQQQPQPGAEGQQQAQQQPQQQAEQSMLPEPFAGVLRIIVNDCTADADVDRSADAIGSAIKSQPDLEATFAQWLSAPASQLVEVIAQYGQAPWLTKMSTSIAWFGSLQEELSERSQAAQPEEDGGPEEPAPVPAGSNGHKASGAGAM